MKLKVFVTDEDGRWSRDDDVDGFVHLLRLTPARSASTASWTTITIYGLRPRYKTTLVVVHHLPTLVTVCFPFLTQFFSIVLVGYLHVRIILPVTYVGLSTSFTTHHSFVFIPDDLRLTCSKIFPTIDCMYLTKCIHEIMDPWTSD